MPALTKVNFLGDPWASDAIAAAEYARLKSAGYSGSYANLTAPASPNYPFNTPARYFLELPGIVDISDAVTRPYLFKDVTTGVTLTGVSGSPAANQYRIPIPASKRPHVIELNSAQAGHTIAYDFYSSGSIANAGDFNTPEIIGALTVTGAITGNLTGNATSASRLKMTDGIFQRDTYLYRFDASGSWDMDAAANMSLGTSYGPAIPNGVIDLTVIIGNNSGLSPRKRYNLLAGGYFELSGAFPTPTLVLYRTAGGIFDNSAFAVATIDLYWTIW